MKKIEVIITGSKGIIGSRIAKKLKDKYQVRPIHLGELNIEETDLDKIKLDIINKLEDLILDPKNERCLLFAHRLRVSKTTEEALCAKELCILRTISNYLSLNSKKLNVVLIGSCTGRLFDRNSPESYHYIKVLQNAFIQYIAMSRKNVYANTIELFNFFKYEEFEADSSFIKKMEQCKSNNNDKKVPGYEELYELIDFLFCRNQGINSQVIKLDSGELQLQNT